MYEARRREELGIGTIDNANDVVKVGDEISVVVLNPHGREGHPIVSRKRAEFESTWDRIVQEFVSTDCLDGGRDVIMADVDAQELAYVGQLCILNELFYNYILKHVQIFSC